MRTGEAHDEQRDQKLFAMQRRTSLSPVTKVVIKGMQNDSLTLAKTLPQALRGQEQFDTDPVGATTPRRTPYPQLDAQSDSRASPEECCSGEQHQQVTMFEDCPQDTSEHSFVPALRQAIRKELITRCGGQIAAIRGDVEEHCLTQQRNLQAAVSNLESDFCIFREQQELRIANLEGAIADARQQRPQQNASLAMERDELRMQSSAMETSIAGLRHDFATLKEQQELSACAMQAALADMRAERSDIRERQEQHPAQCVHGSQTASAEAAAGGKFDMCAAVFTARNASLKSNEYLKSIECEVRAVRDRLAELSAIVHVTRQDLELETTKRCEDLGQARAYMLRELAEVRKRVAEYAISTEQAFRNHEHGKTSLGLRSETNSITFQESMRGSGAPSSCSTARPRGTSCNDQQSVSPVMTRGRNSLLPQYSTPTDTSAPSKASDLKSGKPLLDSEAAFLRACLEATMAEATAGRGNESARTLPLSSGYPARTVITPVAGTGSPQVTPPTVSGSSPLMPSSQMMSPGSGTVPTSSPLSTGQGLSSISTASSIQSLSLTPGHLHKALAVLSTPVSKARARSPVSRLFSQPPVCSSAHAIKGAGLHQPMLQTREPSPQANLNRSRGDMLPAENRHPHAQTRAT